MRRALPDKAAWQALIQERMAQEGFDLPDTPDWSIECPAVTAYKAGMVRYLRAVAHVRGYTHAQLAWRLRVSPRQVRRILDGHVVLHEPEKLHRMVLRLDPQATVPTPDMIPPMSETEREEALAGIRGKIDASLADPRPSVSSEEVFAALRAQARTWQPLFKVPPEGRLSHGRYAAIYARDPDADLYHGEVEGLRDLVIFQARTLPEMATAFAKAVTEYEAFCQRRAA